MTWFVIIFHLQPCHWPLYGQNTESVGELWLGLLRFYTEDFDFREHVVCIRQHTRLTTFNKQWTSKYIVIEGQFYRHSKFKVYCWTVPKILSFLIPDPFDLNHNLGVGLSRRSMISVPLFEIYIFIRSVFYVCILMCYPISWFFCFYHLNSDKLYHEGVHQWKKSVWHTHERFPTRVSQWNGEYWKSRPHNFIFYYFFMTSILNLVCRSISLTLKFWPREKLHQTIAAVASVERSDTFWKTAPCATSGFNHSTFVWIDPCFQLKCLERYVMHFCRRPKHRRESENRPEHFHDSTEEFMDPVRYRNEHWKKRDALDMRCCFLCGSSTHIKKDCHLYRSPAGSWMDFVFLNYYLIYY